MPIPFLVDPLREPGTRGAARGDRWIDRWLLACADLAELKRSNPMTDAVIDEIDGRMIRIGDQWLADFASCNYLGFDLDTEIIDAVPEYLRRWGTHPSWSRLLGSPVLYEQIEARLTALLGCEDSLVLPTITHIHMSVIPLLAASGTVFLDARARRGRPSIPVRGPGSPGRAPAGRTRPDALGVHGRREQHDRQRPRSRGV